MAPLLLRAVFQTAQRSFTAAWTTTGMSPHLITTPTGKYDSVLPQCPNANKSNVLKIRRGDHVTAGKHSSELFAEGAIDWLKKYDFDNPFFMYISFMAPHDPRTMPQKYLDMYDPEDTPLPENFMGGHPFDNGDLKVRDEVLEDFPRDPYKVRQHIAEYYAMITHLDAQMGRVLDTINARGMADNTIVIFAGDNGLAVGQHGLFWQTEHVRTQRARTLDIFRTGRTRG